MGCGLSTNKRFGKSRKSDMSKAELTIKSTILIQKWYRRYRQRLEARRQCAWAVFQSVEYASEQTQLQLFSFFNEMMQYISRNGSDIENTFPLVQSPFKSSSGEDQEFAKHAYHANLAIESDYSGPHFTFPLNTKQIQDATKLFKEKKTLHIKYLCDLLLHARNKLKTFDNVRHATTAVSHKITICGDLHGNLDDLLMIFYKNGPPAENNPYVFNGDLVDRGDHSIEVCVILLCYFLLYPNDVYLNRGNHEDPIMNLRYGFISEINRKYKLGKKVLRLFEGVFCWLPLATVIDNKVFVLHGGIADTTDLEYLSSIDRHTFISILRPIPMYNKINETLMDTISEEKERQQLCDILWSDPCSEDGCFPNTYRGGGCYFGADTTKKFLSRYGYELLVRSHECKSEGYEYFHDGMLVTIFSASNYYGPGTNKGAYLKLEGPTLERKFVQYMSPKGQHKRKMTPAQRIQELENNAIRTLWEKIATVKSNLLSEFQKYDKNDSGTIKPYEWFCAMQDITGLKLSWRSLLPKMAVCDPKGNVLYETTFEKFAIHPALSQFSQNEEILTERLYRYKDSLETLFRMIDRDNSGYISMAEFEDAFKVLDSHIHFSLPPSEVSQLAQCMDMNKDGYIEFHEFLQAFRVVEMNSGNGPTDMTASFPNTDSNDFFQETGTTLGVIGTQ